MIGWFRRVLLGRQPRRDVSRLAGGDLDTVFEVVEADGAPLKPGHRRRALRDPRLLPKPWTDRSVPAWERPKRRPTMSKVEAERLFSATGRTRNRALRELAPDEAQLERLGLPRWRDEADLAAALGITIGELHHYASHRDDDRVCHYVRFAIAKRRGGQRVIMAPKRRLKALQRRLLDALVQRLPVSDAAHGFVRGRSVRSNAAPHVGRRVLLRLDLADFFPSVTFARVRGLLVAYGYGYPVANTLAVLMTEAERQPVDVDGSLRHVPVTPRYCPQGAPTSPGLCNALLLRFDRRLAGLARAHGFAYTRYADDLTFSGDAPERVQALQRQALWIIGQEGFRANAGKTRIVREGQRQAVTGVTVNHTLGLSRRERRRLRAALHRQRAGRLDADAARRLHGKLAYLRMLNVTQYRRLLGLGPPPPRARAALAGAGEAIGFLDLLAAWRERGTPGTEDLLFAVLPLMKQVMDTHDRNLVAPLDGVDSLGVSLGHLWYANADARPARRSPGGLGRAAAAAPQAFEISGRFRERVDDGTGPAGGRRLESGLIASREDAIKAPAYLLDYAVWEHAFGQHDALSDVFALGLLLASLATLRDFTQREDLEAFVLARRDLAALNPRLHPVVARMIARMTDLERERRPRDLRTVIQALEHYRFQEVADDEALDAELARTGDSGARRRLIQGRLRDRLFEISRRNRLLYFRETARTTNLTVGSVPRVMDPAGVRADQILITDRALCERIAAGRTVALSSWLRFEDYPFLAVTLDNVRLQARRDEKEYGFSQLRLVLAFLSWSNLKEAPEERIRSPLVLLPVRLRRRKGVKDSFELEFPQPIAEVNPALRHHLRQLYDLRLPEQLDVSDFSAIAGLHADLAAQIAASDRGVELALVRKPRIRIIHRTAERRLDDFLRRQRRTGRGLKAYGDLTYSYAARRYAPLGIQLFDQRVRAVDAPARDALEGTRPRPAPEWMAPPAASAEAGRDVYTIDDGDTGARAWEMDLCAVTLASFNYRKMTLVRDYADLIADGGGSTESFDRLFSDEARPAFAPVGAAGLAEDRLVLPADPSQKLAVARARSGQSYVVQGPPGTGKSQTITNLVADFVARGRSVLFVCEKRAALDVVHHRLRQTGLDPLCTLIHDSQEDKKAFLDDLEALYSSWVAAAPDDGPERERAAAVRSIERRLTEYARFSAAMRAQPPGCEETLRDLLERWIASGARRAELAPAVRQWLPRWQDFLAARETVAELDARLRERGYPGPLADSPLQFLGGALERAERPVLALEEAIPRCLAALDELAGAEAHAAEVATAAPLRFEQLERLAALALELAPLAEAGRLELLDPDEPAAARLARELERLDALAREAAACDARASGWRDGADIDDLRAAHAAAVRWEGSVVAWLVPGWWRARTLVRRWHERPATRRGPALAAAIAAHDARAAAARARAAIAQRIGLDDVGGCAALLGRLWDERAGLAPEERDLIAFALRERSAGKAVLRLRGDLRPVARAREELEAIFSGYRAATRDELAARLRELAANADLAFDFLDLVASLDRHHAEVAQALRNVPLDPRALERATLQEGIERELERGQSLTRFDGARLDRMNRELAASLAELRRHNARLAVETARRRFLDNHARANQSLAGLPKDEQDARRAYNRGRKLLEREFEKSRQHRAIRELFAADSGAPLRDLKPVWLMSPLSVADVLPLAGDLFDVVIFDEASQIPLEDAVPALSRSRQLIVVGDEMQLPPSRFFLSQRTGEDADEPGPFVFDLNADSFLVRAAGSLPGTMLEWHYRSRDESLIAFCNQAFYRGRLKTVPDRAAPAPRAPIVVAGPADAEAGARQALARPISFHHLAGGVYESQRNAGEARYIAELVRRLLAATGGASLGVVAFSQAQQGEIESAIAELAGEDAAFRERLEAEEEREEDGQYVGLFVKNLENVQGDERDVIILSVCYAPGPGGRMVMNFGPINQNGGEKRLNVIFSRAKRHMVVVSSIVDSQITNTYNAGADALRRYLGYAAAVSIGRETAIATALGALSPVAAGERAAGAPAFLGTRLGAAIAERGRSVEVDHGRSELRCAVAVRDRAGEDFRLAVLSDPPQAYALDDELERYFMRPSVLEAFGWEVRTVLARDWFTDPDGAVARVTGPGDADGDPAG